MIKNIKMPSAGQTTDEAIVGDILVKVGSLVKKGDILLETETDKATMPVESYADGIVLDILISKGDTVDAGTTLVVIGNEADKIAYKRTSTKDSSSEPKEVASDFMLTNAEKEEDEYQSIFSAEVEKELQQEQAAVIERIPKVIKAMPNAKLLARNSNVDLSQVKPVNGQIIKRSDVEIYIAGVSENLDSYEVMKMTRMRSAIGQRMCQSLKDIPQFQITISIDMTNAIALKDWILLSKNVKISYNDIMCLVLSKVAKEFTLMNSRYEGGEVRIFKHINIGIAVGLDDGLVVPVTKTVDKMSILEIASVNAQNIKKAREGTLVASDMGCGTFSISNLGMFDIKSFTAIINPPESCIFAVSSIEKRPVWDGSSFVACPMMDITVSFDHRIIDGSYGAKMLRMFKSYMENPAFLLAE